VTHRSLMVDLASWAAVAILLALGAANYQTIRRYIFDTVVAHAPVPQQRVASVAEVDASQRSTDAVELRADRAGHYAANMEINGRRFDGMVDTGASLVMLTYDDAQRAGIYLRPSDFTMHMQTANGIAKAAPVSIDRLAIGNITVRNVQAAVGEPGLLTTNLLGMSFLKRLRKFEISSGTLTLVE
jgi:aspartyl protease family protein